MGGLIENIFFFLHLLSAMLISVAVFGLPIVELAIKQSQREIALSLHRLTIDFSRLARIGGFLALLTGIYNWVHIGGFPGWLLVKLILFVWFIISGIFVGVKYVSKRGEILSVGDPDEGKLGKLNDAIRRYAYINLLVFLLIVFLAVFKLF
ncbi:Predicted integral membrane protein (DUF2269) [Candidatus Thermokryptus mobilis]|uniref:Predicted integral membrane protein (DUF2269) n=1 Tax=Candidatus Thermokryptus mobilis TaxID=1643428 RepID=A0A0S4MWZ4_9BACT|nr:hypothetical protein [Candidatus Thermokryptus mobilis]CUU01997.1 Predicted integral membrane protein (DUF2269) [Candidatus Thermokryptus mobilis]